MAWHCDALSDCLLFSTAHFLHWRHISYFTFIEHQNFSRPPWPKLLLFGPLASCLRPTRHYVTSLKIAVIVLKFISVKVRLTFYAPFCNTHKFRLRGGNRILERKVFDQSIQALFCPAPQENALPRTSLLAKLLLMIFF